MKRIKIKYRQLVDIPEKYFLFFWDEREKGAVILEKYIVRLLTYGSSQEIRELAAAYPAEVRDVLGRYRERLPLYRGLKTFVNLHSRI